MWESINHGIIVAEIILAVIGILFVYGRKNAVKTFVFLCAVFMLNLTIYILPALYEKVVLEEGRNFLFYLLDCIPAAVKSLVGDTETGLVEGYAEVFPVYVYIYFTGLALAVAATSYAAITTFGRRVLNVFNVALTLGGSSCDIIAGSSAEALGYAKNHKKTIVVLAESVEKSFAHGLINDGYTVIRRKLTKEFFDSRYFNRITRYNVIYPNDKNDYSGVVNTIISYFDTRRKTKNFHFYVEAEEKVLSTAKRQVDIAGEEYRESITFFSRNELIARTFVDENPIVRDMPEEFFDEDTAVKEGIDLNMFMLGYGSLSREIYRQFVINNQLAVYKGGEYRAFPINYFFYDKNADEKAWEINGLSDTLKALAENSAEYFPLPDMPYTTKCISEGGYEFDCIKEITKTVVKENSFSYIVIDTGDVYRNVEIADRFKLLLDKCSNFRIFVYNNSSLPECDGVTYYGNTQELFTHDVIVNESLADLAKSVNRFYSGSDNWSELTYFDMNSNISLASNLRLKLNFLGLDYSKDGECKGEDLVKKVCESYLDKDFVYSKCFGRSKRNAMLAQEHFRWNAYHLLSGYLPMKKRRITVEKNDGKIKKVIKNNALKKHCCITTFAGLDELSRYLSEKANEISGSEGYTAEDFDYYKYDDLLLRALPDFMKENKYSVIEK